MAVTSFHFTPSITQFNCIADWLKFSHSPWLEQIINILFLLFPHLSISFIQHEHSTSTHPYKTLTTKKLIFSYNQKTNFRSLSRNYKSSHLSESASQYFRGGRPSSKKSSYSSTSNMEFLRGVYAFMQVSRSSVSVEFSIY